MDRREQAEFAAALIGLAEIFDAELSPTKAEAYFLALEEHSLQDVLLAIKQAIKTCRFFPKPAELIEALEGSPDDQAEAAWVQWIEKTGQAGAYENVVFEDAAIGQALMTMFGSWADACRMSKDEEGYRHAEFKKLYRMFRKHGPREPMQLIGLHSTENALTGYSSRASLPAARQAEALPLTTQPRESPKEGQGDEVPF